MSRAKNNPRSGGRRAEVNADFHLPAQSTGGGVAAEAQRERILRALSLRPHNSYELRRAGCYQCPTRVLELRRAGYTIETTRVMVVDQDGFEHPRVALYSLREAQEGAVR